MGKVWDLGHGIMTYSYNVSLPSAQAYILQTDSEYSINWFNNIQLIAIVLITSEH